MKKRPEPKLDVPGHCPTHYGGPELGCVECSHYNPRILLRDFVVLTEIMAAILNPEVEVIVSDEIVEDGKVVGMKYERLTSVAQLKTRGPDERGI